jgi:hypothetical protein
MLVLLDVNSVFRDASKILIGAALVVFHIVALRSFAPTQRVGRPALLYPSENRPVQLVFIRRLLSLFCTIVYLNSPTTPYPSACSCSSVQLGECESVTRWLHSVLCTCSSSICAAYRKV